MMHRKLFFLVSFVLVLGLVSNAPAAITLDWDAEAGDRDWNNPINWDPNQVPADDDTLWLEYDPCDPNRYRLRAPLVTDGVDSGVLYEVYIGGSDDYTVEGEDTNDANIVVVDVNGGILRIADGGMLRIAHRGYGMLNVSGGEIYLGGTLQMGNYGPRWGRARTTAWLNMTGGVIDNAWAGSSVRVPNDFGAAYIQLDGGVIKTSGLDMDRGDVGSSGSVDFNGGTMISNGDRRTRYARYLDEGLVTAFGMQHCSIDPCTGLRAVVAVDYDITNIGKTTMVAMLVDPNKPYAPNPADGSTAGLDPNQKVLLSWGEITGTTLHDVYFGTDFSDVNDANTSSPEYKAPVTNASWYTADALGLGVTRYWRIDEHIPKGSYSTQLADGFEGSPWDDNWDAVASSWYDETGDVNTGSHAAGVDRAIGTGPFTFTSDDLDTSDATYMTVRFAYKWRAVATFTVEYYGTDGWSTPVDLEALGGNQAWVEYTDTIASTKYFHSAFKIRLTASFSGGGTRYAIVDDVEVLKQTAEDFFKGDVWEFTTGDYLVVDDFESYADDIALEAVWLQTTYANVDPSADKHGGVQAMKLSYDLLNDYQEVYRTPTDANWTKEGIKALSLWFKGDPNNVALPWYVKLTGGGSYTKNYPGDLNDIRLWEWQEWNIDLEDFTGVDMNNVTEIRIGFGDGATTTVGFLLFDDIRLYQPRCVTEYRTVGDIVGSDCVVDYEDVDTMTDDWLVSDYNVATSAPANDVNLVAYYSFENAFQDSSGNALHGTAVGNAAIVSDGERGSVLKLDGVGDYVNCSNDPNFNITGDITIAAWIKVALFDKDKQAIATKESSWRIHRRGNSDNISFNHSGLTQGDTDGETSVDDGEWHHVAGVYDHNVATYLYIDGTLDNSQAVTGYIDGNDTFPVLIGEGASRHPTDPNLWVPLDREFDGLIDEVRIYNKALSAAEIAWLADDMTNQGDGYLYVPVRSDADLYSGEAQYSRAVNFRDFAILAADNWLQPQIWP